VLAVAEKALDVEFVPASRTYGTQGTTIGHQTTAGTWVRLAWRPIDDIHAPSWTGIEVASAISGVAIPELYRSFRWLDRERGVVWRADETHLIAFRAIHPSGVIDSDPQLPDAWWTSLGSSLAALAAVETDRVGMTQAHLTRRINQVFGDVGLHTEVDDWTTAHADLHMGNLTAPDCYLLDWESWGRSPRGLDAATLWGHSLLVPSVADRVQQQFAADLGSRSGRLAQLLFCSNVIRLNRGKSVPSPLLEPATHEAKWLLAELSG
jgi:hypothetical protein